MTYYTTSPSKNCVPKKKKTKKPHSNKHGVLFCIRIQSSIQQTRVLSSDPTEKLFKVLLDIKSDFSKLIPLNAFDYLNFLLISCVCQKSFNFAYLILYVFFFIFTQKETAFAFCSAPSKLHFSFFVKTPTFSLSLLFSITVMVITLASNFFLILHQ